MGAAPLSRKRGAQQPRQNIWACSRQLAGLSRWTRFDSDIRPTTFLIHIVSVMSAGFTAAVALDRRSS
jgi:hypothetical protein